MALLSIFIILLLASTASFFVKKKMSELTTIALIASVTELVLAFIITIGVTKSGLYQAFDMFEIDAIGVILFDLVAFVGAMATWYSCGYIGIEFKRGEIGFGRTKQYFTLLHLFLLSMFFAIATTSPIVMWIAIEATTLSTAFLVSFYNSPTAVEAAWKYLLINSVGLLFAFFGTLLFLYPTIRLEEGKTIDWSSLLTNASLFDPFIVKMAFVFVLIGYGTKVGFVPMHTWLPDAHSKAPAPISGLLSGVLLNVAFLAILRCKSVIDLAVGPQFSQGLLICFGAVSVIFAALMIFGQTNYKRLLAYSSIEHMGLIALGFGFGGMAAFVAILHMIYHALTKSLLFLSSGNILLNYGSTKIKNVHGVMKTLPFTGVLFMIGFLSITGVPPFGIFLTEFSMMAEGMKAYPFVTVAVLVAVSLVFIGFLRHIVAMMFGVDDRVSKEPKHEQGGWTIVPIIVLLVTFVTLSVYIPDTLQMLIHRASAY
jgi:hydrogenase-4 component F